MRILNRKEFMRLEKQCVFAKYRPQVTGPIGIKVPYNGPDFAYQDLDPVGMIENDGDVDAMNKIHEMETEKASYPVDLYYYGRDGCYDEDQLFMVLERDDVRKLINRLQEVLDDQ